MPKSLLRQGSSPRDRYETIDADDVAAAYLLSDDANNVTGTTLYVDAGYHSMGMWAAERALRRPVFA